MDHRRGRTGDTASRPRPGRPEDDETAFAVTHGRCRATSASPCRPPQTKKDATPRQTPAIGGAGEPRPSACGVTAPITRRPDHRSAAARYYAGLGYGSPIATWGAAGVGRASAARRVAAAAGTTPAAVRADAAFAAAVAAVAASGGPSARDLLPAGVVPSIARTHPDRQAVALARAGRGPLGKAPPYDTFGCGEVIGRLARTAGLLDHVAGGLLLAPPGE